MQNIERIDKLFERLVSDDKAFDEESAKDVQINEDDVMPDMFVHTSNYRKWALLAQLAERRYYEMKDEVEKVAADCKYAARDDLLKAGKKVTDAAAEEASLLNPLLQATKQQFRACEFIYGKFRVMEKSMEHHRAMLQSINSRQRGEYTTSDVQPSFDDLKEAYRKSRS